MTTGPATPGFVQAGAAPGEPDPPPPGKFGLSYLRLVYPRIKVGWQSFIDDARLRLPPGHALNNTSLSATLAIAADPKGKLVEARVARPSGNADFDAAALEIARDAAPYPLAGRELVGDDGLVRISWLFARDRRQAGLATTELVPERWSVDRAVPKFIAAGDLVTASTRLAAAADKAGRDDAVLLDLGRRIAIEAVRVGLRSKLVEVQRVAVGIASVARAAELAPDLRSLATSVVDHRLRSAAVLALGRLGGDQAIPLLVSAARGERGMRGQSGAAAEALVALGRGDAAAAILTALLDEGGKLTRAEVLGIIARAPVKQLVPRLATIVSARGTPKAERVVACRALGAAAARGGDRKLAVTALRRATASPDAAVRAACLNGVAVAAAAGLRSRVTFWKATELIKRDRDQRVRAAAVRAAAHLEPTRFAKEMYLVARARDPGVLAALAEALSVVPGPVAYKRLLTLVKHEDAVVRRAAAASLSRRAEQGAKAVVAAMTADPDVRVRLIAVPHASAEALIGLVQDPDQTVAFAARVAVVRGAGQSRSLAHMCRELAAAATDVARARVAGAWLAGGLPAGK